MLYRPAEFAKDWDAVVFAVDQLYRNYITYGYSKQPDPRRVEDYIRQHLIRGNAVIVDEAFLVLVGVVEAWHSRDRALEERLVLRLHQGGNINGVPKVLEHLARTLKCDTLLASDSSLGFRMGKVYSRAGMRPITTTYYKEL